MAAPDHCPGSAESTHIPTPAKRQAQATLGELARLFFRLDITAFGGPVAHIAMMKSTWPDAIPLRPF
jgi:hypothetical protein